MGATAGGDHVDGDPLRCADWTDLVELGMCQEIGSLSVSSAFFRLISAPADPDG